MGQSLHTQGSKHIGEPCLYCRRRPLRMLIKHWTEHDVQRLQELHAVDASEEQQRGEVRLE